MEAVNGFIADSSVIIYELQAENDYTVNLVILACLDFP